MNWDGPERRQDVTHALRSELLAHMKEEEQALRELRINIKCLHDSFVDYRPYLDMAIKRECRREKFQRAVIEKTIVTLAWSLLVGLGWLMYEGLLVFFRNVSIK